MTSSQSWAGGQATANELRRVERVLERMKRPSARRRPRRPTPPARWASMAILAPSVHRYHRTDPRGRICPPHSLLSRNRAFAGATANQATGRRTRPRFGDRVKEGRLACQRRWQQFRAMDRGRLRQQTRGDGLPEAEADFETCCLVLRLKLKSTTTLSPLCALSSLRVVWPISDQ